MSTVENLSPEELAELSQALDANSAAESTAARDVRGYDFLHPDKLSKSHLRVLRYIFSGLEKSWSLSLSTATRTEAAVTVQTMEQARFGSYAESFERPSMVVAMKLASLSSVGVLDMPAKLALCIVDRLTGGKGKWPGEPRNLTQIERKIMKRVIDAMVEDLSQAWSPVTALGAETTGFWNSAEDAGIGADTMVLVVGLSLSIGFDSYKLNFAMPAGALDSVRDLLTPENWCKQSIAGPKTDSAPITDLIAPMIVEAEVELGRAKVSMNDLMSLGVGDVIRLDKLTGDSLEVKIGGQMKFRALPGLMGNKVAVRITDFADDSEDERPANDVPHTDHTDMNDLTGKDFNYDGTAEE